MPFMTKFLGYKEAVVKHGRLVWTFKESDLTVYMGVFPIFPNTIALIHCNCSLFDLINNNHQHLIKQIATYKLLTFNPNVLSSWSSLTDIVDKAIPRVNQFNLLLKCKIWQCFCCVQASFWALIISSNDRKGRKKRLLLPQEAPGVGASSLRV